MIIYNRINCGEIHFIVHVQYPSSFYFQQKYTKQGFGTQSYSLSIFSPLFKFTIFNTVFINLQLSRINNMNHNFLYISAKFFLATARPLCYTAVAVWGCPCLTVSKTFPIYCPAAGTRPLPVHDADPHQPHSLIKRCAQFGRASPEAKAARPILSQKEKGRTAG